MSIANFFIIGAAKSGTTSLQSYLNQHPDICFSKNKEPNYYAFAGQNLPEKGPVDEKLLYQLRYSNCVTEFEQYKQQFSIILTLRLGLKKTLKTPNLSPSCVSPSVGFILTIV
jgi:hypothetical protein